MQDKLKCAVYTRVSTDNQAEVEFNSCEAQEAKIRSFIKSQDFERAAKLRDQERTSRGELDKINKEWGKKRDQMQPHVDVEEVAKIVAQWTGIPIFRLEQKESEKLLKIEEEIHKRVVDQDEAISVLPMR